jgi:hypothetical protein
MIRRQQRTIETQMRREVRKVEAEAREANHGQDIGTGQTILKLQRHQPPLRTLLEGRKIGALELQAADQIALAAFSVATGGILRAVSLEQVSHGRQNDSPWPAHVALAVRNYQKWQNHWSAEWKRNRCPMLETIWSAVIDERPISVIAQEINCGRARTARAIIAGLRHYAAWCDLVTGAQRQAWIAAAQHVFDRRLQATSS